MRPVNYTRQPKRNGKKKKNARIQLLKIQTSAPPRLTGFSPLAVCLFFSLFSPAFPGRFLTKIPWDSDLTKGSVKSWTPRAGEQGPRRSGRQDRVGKVPGEVRPGEACRCPGGQLPLPEVIPSAGPSLVQHLLPGHMHLFPQRTISGDTDFATWKK